MGSCTDPIGVVDEGPRCSRCGVEVTTGFMAAICPHREKCEFWPDDKESQDFLDSMGWRLSLPAARG